MHLKLFKNKIFKYIAINFTSTAFNLESLLRCNISGRFQAFGKGLRIREAGWDFAPYDWS